MDAIKITIYGRPEQWRRTGGRTKDGRPVRFTPAKTRDYEHRIKQEAGRYFVRPFKGPVKVDMLAVFPRPKAKIWKTKPMPREWYPKAPDLDNIVKAAMDGLNGIAYLDDRQVVMVVARKILASGDELPRLELTIGLMEGWE